MTSYIEEHIVTVHLFNFLLENKLHSFHIKTKQTLLITLLFSLLSVVSLAQPTVKQNDDGLLKNVKAYISKHPLQPANTSSPRATLTSFLKNTNMAYRLLLIATNNMQTNPGLFKSKKTKKIELYIHYYLKRSTQCLNLTKIPPNIIKQITTEKILLLKEILDRLSLPPLNTVPNNSPDKPVTIWEIPNTKIIIQQVEEGPHKDQFLFSPHSIKNLDGYYKTIKQVAYQSNNLVSPHFYEGYISTAGGIIPPKWATMVPAWASTEVYDQTIWQWFSTIFLTLALAYIIKRLWNISQIQYQKKPTLRYYYLSFFTLAFSLLLQSSFYVINQIINITGNTLNFLNLLYSGLSTVSLAFFSLFILRALTAYFFQKSSHKKTKVSSISHPLAVIFGVLSFIAVMVYGLHNLGAPVVSLLTGLGVGGLALALAMRSTLGNILGSFTLFIDKPYLVGDFVKILGHQGTIEHIGLRSTQIRLVCGTIISLPNEKASGAEIENMTQRKGRRESLEISLPTSSSPQQIDQAISIIQQAFLSPNQNTRTPAESNVIDKNQAEALQFPVITPIIGLSRLSDRTIIINADYTFPSKNYLLFNKHLYYINQRIFNDLHELGIKVGW